MKLSGIQHQVLNMVAVGRFPSRPSIYRRNTLASLERMGLVSSKPELTSAGQMIRENRMRELQEQVALERREGERRPPSLY